MHRYSWPSLVRCGTCSYRSRTCLVPRCLSARMYPEHVYASLSWAGASRFASSVNVTGARSSAQTPGYLARRSLRFRSRLPDLKVHPLDPQSLSPSSYITLHHRPSPCAASFLHPSLPLCGRRPHVPLPPFVRPWTFFLSGPPSSSRAPLPLSSIRFLYVHRSTYHTPHSHLPPRTLRFLCTTTHPIVVPQPASFIFRDGGSGGRRASPHACAAGIFSLPPSSRIGGDTSLLPHSSSLSPPCILPNFAVLYVLYLFSSAALLILRPILYSSLFLFTPSLLVLSPPTSCTVPSSYSFLVPRLVCADLPSHPLRPLPPIRPCFPPSLLPRCPLDPENLYSPHPPPPSGASPSSAPALTFSSSSAALKNEEPRLTLSLSSYIPRPPLLWLSFARPFLSRTRLRLLPSHSLLDLVRLHMSILSLRYAPFFDPRLCTSTVWSSSSFFPPLCPMYCTPSRGPVPYLLSLNAPRSTSFFHYSPLVNQHVPLSTHLTCTQRPLRRPLPSLTSSPSFRALLFMHSIISAMLPLCTYSSICFCGYPPVVPGLGHVVLYPIFCSPSTRLRKPPPYYPRIPASRSPSCILHILALGVLPFLPFLFFL